MLKESPIITGTAGGTLLSTMAMLQYDDIISTAFLAAVGASVSFIVSWLLNKGTKVLQKSKEREKHKKKGK